MNAPTHEEISAAMDVLKAAECKIQTKMSNGDPTSIVFVVHVPLAKMDPKIEALS